MRNLPKPANQPCVRSTTQRCFPNRLLLSMPFRAMRLVIPRRFKYSRQRLVVVPFVRMQFGRSAAWPAFKSFDRWQCIQALLEQHGVMPVCSTDQHNKGSATSIYDDVTLGAELATVRGVGACFLAPRGLGTDEPSMLARPQSIWSYSRRCSSIARCSRCQTPAACHSRRRLQHVIPLPWPSDWGRFSQGMPVSRT